jgi:lipid-binding SYLF domain-containing protein
MRLVLVAVLALTPLLAKDKEHDRRLAQAEALFSEVMGNPDTGIPQKLFDKALCIVIVPARDTPAFTYFGRHGKGYVSCRLQTGKGWSAPGSIGIEGGSIDLQIGTFSTDMILLVMNERTEDKLLSREFRLGTDASIAAGPVGEAVTDETDAQRHADVLSWSRLQLLFTGFALEGAVLQEDLDANAKLYGKKLENRDIVTKGVAVPPAAAKLMAQLNRYLPKEQQDSKE